MTDMAEEECLFCADWTAREELQLLETIEQFGYGNWAAVSDKMGWPPEVCSVHYEQCYVDSAHPLMPILTVPSTPEPSSQTLIVNDHNDRGGDPVSPYYAGQEIGCYMPHRGDFAVEPINGAECIISDLELEPDEEDDKLMSALKLAAVRMYCEKVKQRAFRKWLVREYGLIDIRKQMATDKIKLSKTQLAIKRQLRPFMRFMRPQTAYTLIQSLFLADELRDDIRRLKGYRMNGLTTKQGAELCEMLKKKRRQQQQQYGEAIKNACTAEESLFSQLVLLRPEDKTAVKERLQPAPVYDISHLSGVEKLTEEERVLCQVCRLHPEALLGYMAQLEVEGRRFGGVLRLVDARRLLKIDVNKTRKIFNFLASKGRISQ